MLFVGVQYFKLGSKIGHLSESEIDYYHERTNLMLWISEFCYSWSIYASKLSVLLFYRRIFQLLPVYWAILVLMGSCSVWILLRTFMTVFRCWPVDFFWDKSIDDGTCVIDAAVYYFATDLTHTLLDCLILALPIFEVLKMKLPFGQKIAVAGLFSFGFFVCVASAFQIVEASSYDQTSLETPFDLAPAMTWAGVEINLAVFASCCALLRPVFRLFLPGLSNSGSGSSNHSIRPVLQLQPSTSPAMAPQGEWSHPEWPQTSPMERAWSKSDRQWS
jgi:hypothetical protein